MKISILVEVENLYVPVTVIIGDERKTTNMQFAMGQSTVPGSATAHVKMQGISPLASYLTSGKRLPLSKVLRLLADEFEAAEGKPEGVKGGNE